MKMIRKISETFDLPLEYAAGEQRVELSGHRAVRIEQHRGILQYDQNLITVKGSGADISIRGSNMELELMTEEELIVKGQIFGIDLVY